MTCLRHNKGVTFGATLRAQGTSPPAATISGTAAYHVALYIQIDTAGDETVATFKWSKVGGTTFVETLVPVSNSPYVLGDTGIVVDFPVGTYATNNIYRGTASAWADQGPAGNNATNATASAQPYVASNGMVWDGADVLDFAGSLSCATCSFFAVMSQPVTPDADDVIFLTDKHAYYGDLSSNGHFSAYANAAIDSGITLGNPMQLIEAVERAANDIDIGVNGVIVNRTNGAGYPARGYAKIGSEAGFSFSTMIVKEICFFGTALSASAAKRIRAAMAARNAIAA